MNPYRPMGFKEVLISFLFFLRLFLFFFACLRCTGNRDLTTQGRMGPWEGSHSSAGRKAAGSAELWQQCGAALCTQRFCCPDPLGWCCSAQPTTL